MTDLKEKQNIPNGWVSKTLSDFGTTLAGLSGKNKDNFGHGVPYIQYMNVFSNSHLNKAKFGLVDISDGKKQNPVLKDDYLFTISSETPKEVGMSSVVNKDLGEVYLNSFCFIYRQNKDYIESNYGGYLFRGSEFRKNVSRQAKGSTRFNLSKSDFLKLEVAFPESKQEQQKIAEILGAVDEDIAKTQEVIDTTDKLEKGLMQEFFSKSNVKDKNWKIIKLQDVCKVRQGLQIPIKKRFKEAGENRFIYITLKYLKELENTEYIENPSKSVMCRKEDILMTRTGNTGIVVTNVSGVFHNNFFLVDFDRKEIIKDFLVYYLKSDKIQRIILDRAGTTTIPDLNHGDFYSINFVMPPIKEQQKIAEILSAVDEKISVNKKLKAKLTQLKKGLMQDLLSGKVRVDV